MIDVAATFAKFDDEFLKGPSVGRPDLAAFNLLDKLLPGTRDIVCAAGHDQIWLDVDVEELGNVATEGDILELVHAGVFYESDTDSLSMFA